ncbi:acetoacetate--CoA ligase [Yinghuangia sp. ASG 101]|uniref:acetoacetate--CoA ligase n=1 Tax=Yinghuangia sp. ASG 101 TaxID=2896848 RepID=UPI001E375724|nr:acetoacetate--CoA ligase [Yinghuangia sp. ASG 101]UGQ10758.1 acetoacetate--CoA ligase [Yinghuangia sp. ASG 101]
MSTVPEPPAAPEILWRPSEARVRAARITDFAARTAENRGIDPFADYADLWSWSIDEPEAFWASVCAYFDVAFSAPPTRVLADARMPGAAWFPHARLNYARHALRRAETHPDETAVVHLDETLDPREITWGELRRAVAAFAHHLRDIGVGPGDRVAAYLPNIPEAVVAMLGCASVGAVWSSCAPDFGARGALDRLRQIDPVVLIAVDGYRHAGKEIDRRTEVAEITRELPTLRQTVHVPLLGHAAPAGAVAWADTVRGDHEDAYEPVEFDHPLWILYSSGTTGLPKAIVHGHGGILLEHLKHNGLHLDLGPGDRFFWYTSTGWMMWNLLIGGLLVGSAIVLYDGSPAFPDPDTQWTVAERTGTTVFGTSAAYLMGCRKHGLRPRETHDLSRLRCVGTTGSPLPPDGFRWVYEDALPDVWLASVSGGTDVCSGFLGGVPTLPVYSGELQARLLGCAVYAWDERGRPVTDRVGELVLTAPMPSMPTMFWNDPDNSRYTASYFDTYPGVWRHGDWITITSRGTAVVHGRSDSTLNRQGIRMGSADIYEAVESIPEIAEALVVGIEQPDGDYWMPLFVVLAPGAALDDALRARVKETIRTRVSPRHIPDDIIEAPGVPHTLTGKRLEIPVKRLLQGRAVAEAVNPGSVDNPDLLRFYTGLAAERASAEADATG